MSKLSHFVRFRGTALEGYITQRVIHNGEEMFIVCWNMSAQDESRPLTADQLESIDREDTRAHDVIHRAFAGDRKTIEEDNQAMGGGSVEHREVFRSKQFQRL